MTSGDNILTVEIFNEGIREIRQEVSELKAEVSNIRYEQRLSSAKIDWLQTSVYWGFAVLGVVIAIAALVVGIVGLKPILFNSSREKPKAKITHELRNAIREVVREELAKNLPTNLPGQGR